MSTTRTRRAVRRTRLVVALALLLVSLSPSLLAWATPTARVSGNGSSWAGNAIADWQAAVKAQGVTVDYTPDGSSSGRKNFAVGLADFAVSEIPYTGDTADPQDSQKPNFDYALLPVVAGGTSFMYNLPVGGKRFEALQLSQQAIAKIFSGQVTQWNDPVIAATNPGVALPAQRITVVVRSDGSGATAQFTLWMLRQFGSDYAALCAKTGCNAGVATSYFPYQGLSNFTAQSGSNGVTTYTANTPYTINYDEFSYALGVGFPVVKVQNAAGYFTVPTDSAVAVALTQAQINQDKTSLNYLAQDLANVYAYKDPRTYAISAYSYLVVPAETRGNFTTDKGATLAYFSAFSLCEGQRTMGALGYSPLPMNLVLAAMDQTARIPGIDADTSKLISDTKSGVKAGSGNPCNNPTFQPGDDPAHNILTDTAPFPAGCDAACQAPWIRASSSTGATGTGTGTGGKTKGGGKKNTSGGATTPTDGTASADPASTAPASGSGTDASTPGAVGGSAAPAGDTPPTCDADTGICAGADPAVTTDGASTAVASTTVLSGESAWGSAQAALVICLLVMGMLIVLPPLAARLLDARKGPLVTAVDERPRVTAMPAVPVAPVVARVPPAIGSGRDVASYVLSLFSLVLVALLVQLTLISQLQHFAAQKSLYSELRLHLAEGSVPIGQLDINGRLVIPGTPVALIEIPEIGVREVVVEGTTSSLTRRGVGHRKDTPLPGQAGWSVLMGRAAAYGGVFGRLDELAAGDTFSVTTGQGVSTYRVIGPRIGVTSLPVMGSGDGRLTLITASGRSFMPVGVLRVDAQLVSAAFARPAVAIAPGNIDASEQALAADPSVLFSLSWLLELLVAVSLAAVWAWKRWGHLGTWIACVPLLGAVGIACADRICALLPNLV